MLKFYGYDKCSTCRKAKSVLKSKNKDFQDINITETPPSVALLKSILAEGDYALKDLLNTSGELYRALNMKVKLPTMSEKQILELLATHGKLVKRPIVTDGKRHTVGYKEESFAKTWR